jgi:hypothetical protein
MEINTIPPGQMSENEREYIYNTVKKINSKLSIESGTWYGGGSTLSITKGMYETKGVLHTFEEHYDFYKVAKEFYDNSIYANNIKLYNSSFIKGISELSDEFLKSVDLILLDGGDESPDGNHKLNVSSYLNDYNISENVQSFKLLENKISIGCNLLLHDWSIIEGRGNFIKRYLESTTNNNNFELVTIMEGSTGLAHLKKIK